MDVFAVIERFRAAGIPAEHAIAAARIHLGATAGSKSPPKAVPDALSRLPGALADLVRETAHAHNVTVSDLMGTTRKHNVSRARNACFAGARAMGMSLPEIGAHFHRDHSTVMHGLAGHRRRTAAAEAS
jgi:hypothetical protein